MKENPNLHCSFCAKSDKDVVKLIAGPKAYICNECVALCDEILAKGETQIDLAKSTGQSGIDNLRRVLPQLGDISNEEILSFLASHYGLPVMSREAFGGLDIIDRFTVEECREHKIFPYRVTVSNQGNDVNISVAMACPDDEKARSLIFSKFNERYRTSELKISVAIMQDILDALDRETVLRKSAEQHGMNAVSSLKNFVLFDQTARDELSGEFCRDNACLPLFLVNNLLLVAVADPSDKLLEGLKKISVKDIVRVLAHKAEILAIVEREYFPKTEAE